MKKLTTKISSILLVALLLVGVVACKENSGIIGKWSAVFDNPQLAMDSGFVYDFKADNTLTLSVSSAFSSEISTEESTYKYNKGDSLLEFKISDKVYKYKIVEQTPEKLVLERDPQQGNPFDKLVLKKIKEK